MSRIEHQWKDCRKYLAWVRTQPCCCCGHPETIYHHLIGKGDGMMGAKAADFDTLPLCGRHHTGDLGIHTLGVDEWEAEFGDQNEMVRKTLLRAIQDGVLVLGH